MERLLEYIFNKKCIASSSIYMTYSFDFFLNIQIEMPFLPQKN